MTLSQIKESNNNLHDTYEVFLTDPIAYFYDETGNFARDPSKVSRSLRRPDAKAIYSVLQFGAIIPPLSPWCGVSRFTPGYRYHGSNQVGPLRVDHPIHVASLDPDGQSNEICCLVDQVIKRTLGNGPDPVVLFSGGVDSGLIAARLAVLGHRETLLLNYSFGGDDPESRMAEAMAKHLGLRFERVTDSEDPCDCLIEPGRIYVQPFSDSSTGPTSNLAHAMVNRLAGEKRLIFDGTGADGAFGMMGILQMWKRVMDSPVVARHLASFLYRKGLWHNKGRGEYLIPIFRRSATMSLMPAILARNSLADILYDNALARDVYQLLTDWIGDWVGDSIDHRVVAADLAMICANIFAQKARPIWEKAGLEVCYPFLQTESVSVALTSIGHWQMDEPKAPLKKCLARHVPREMVYRPKSGFTDPRRQVFYDSHFIAYLRAAADPTSPIVSILRKKPLMKACDMLARGDYLPGETLSCLWAITFLDRWYRTVPKM